MKSGRRLQPGHLLSSEERRILKETQRDLEQQLARCGDPFWRGVLERQLASVERERETDRDVRRTLPRNPKRGRR